MKDRVVHNNTKKYKQEGILVECQPPAYQQVGVGSGEGVPHVDMGSARKQVWTYPHGAHVTRD